MLQCFRMGEASFNPERGKNGLTEFHGKISDNGKVIEGTLKMWGDVAGKFPVGQVVEIDRYDVDEFKGNVSYMLWFAGQSKGGGGKGGGGYKRPDPLEYERWVTGLMTALPDIKALVEQTCSDLTADQQFEIRKMLTGTAAIALGDQRLQAPPPPGYAKPKSEPDPFGEFQPAGPDEGDGPDDSVPF